MTEITKGLSKYIATDDLDRAIEELLKIGDELDDKCFYNEVIIQSTKLAHWHKLQRLGTEDYVALAMLRSKVSVNLLELIAQLPEKELELVNIKVQNIDEDQFKNQLLILLLLVKFGLVGWGISLWQAGGFYTKEVSSLLVMVVPSFILVLVPMVNDIYFRQKRKVRYFPNVSRRFQVACFVFLLLYGLFVVIILNGGANRTIDFLLAIILLGGIESLFALFVGKMLLPLFKN